MSSLANASSLGKSKQKFSITDTISNIDNLLTNLNELTKKTDHILLVMEKNNALVDFSYDDVGGRYVHMGEIITIPDDQLGGITITGTVKNKSGKITGVEVKWTYTEYWYDSLSYLNQEFVIPYEYFTAKNDTILTELIKKDVNKKIEQVKEYQASRKVQNESWYSLRK